MENKKLIKDIEFHYKKLSAKKLKNFRPSRTLGEELTLQRNYFDIISSQKTNTTNKSMRYNHFLKLLDNEEILEKINNATLLEEYLRNIFFKSDSAEGIECSARITELEKEKNSKLKQFNRNNYFTSYYFFFKLYNFLNFNSFIKLLKKYDVKFQYSNIRILDLSDIEEIEFNIQESRKNYSFYSFISPFLQKFNEKEQVELSLKVGEPSYFIKELLERKNKYITYLTAERLLNVLNIDKQLNTTVKEFLNFFDILDNESYTKKQEIEEDIENQQYERDLQEQEERFLNFGYIYNENKINDFEFTKDMNKVIENICNNLKCYINDSVCKYDMKQFLTVYKVLENLESLTNNIQESQKILALPLNEDVEKIYKFCVENITKRYFSTKIRLDLLDPVEFKEDMKEEEILSVYIPKLKVDFEKNSNNYKFNNYFTEVYTKRKNL